MLSEKVFLQPFLKIIMGSAVQVKFGRLFYHWGIVSVKVLESDPVPIWTVHLLTAGGKCGCKCDE